MKKRSRILSSKFSEHLHAYIELMHNLGRNFRVEEGHLRAFDQFCSKINHAGPLTQALAMEFAFSVPGLSSGQYAMRYRVIRTFSLHLATFDPATERLNPNAVMGKFPRHVAHIYTPQEISALLLSALQLPPHGTLRPYTYHTIIGLMVCTGLRISEVLKLDVDDVDLNRGLILIRQTKFRKSRIVPIHKSTVDALRTYLLKRNEFIQDKVCPAFFINLRKTRICASSTHAVFREIADKTGIPAIVQRRPRFHDLRHTFAVRRVLAWYDAGEDVQSCLQKLATYMGHAHISDTVYYLTAGAELMNRAAERFHAPRSTDANV